MSFFVSFSFILSFLPGQAPYDSLAKPSKFFFNVEVYTLRNSHQFCMVHHVLRMRSAYSRVHRKLCEVFMNFHEHFLKVRVNSCKASQTLCEGSLCEHFARRFAKCSRSFGKWSRTSCFAKFSVHSTVGQ